VRTEKLEIFKAQMFRLKKIKLLSLSGKTTWRLESDNLEAFASAGFDVEITDDTTSHNFELQLNDQAPPLPYGYLEAHFDFSYNKDQSVFCNGFQTWTESKWFSPYDKIPKLRSILKPVWSHFKMNNYGDYDSLHYQQYALHSYHFTCVKIGQEYHLIASLNEENGFSIFIHRGKINQLVIRKEVCTDNEEDTSINLVYLKGKKLNKLYNKYFKLQDIEALEVSNVTGWTSWYNYYTKIDESIILENLSAFADRNIPINTFQIDDGWQRSVGEWLPNEKFPNGMEAIAVAIKKAGYASGLWLAPFICEKNSFIYKEHPEWIRTNAAGKKVVAGYSLDWSGQFYVLEWRNPVVKIYLEKVFNTVLREWNFDMLKLDFLYALTIGLDGRTKGEEMHNAMRWLQRIAGNKKILACGVPLGAAFGKVAYCRISSDVALKWEDLSLASGIRYRERVSTLNALRSTINRALLNHKAFVNDPDVFILRDNNQSLTPVQQNSLYLINQALGSLLFTSDNIAKYNDAKMDLYLKQFPVLTKKVIDMQTTEDHGWVILKNRDLTYLLVFNLHEKPKSVALPKGDWTNALGVQKNEIDLDAFETQILLKTAKAIPQLLYSTAHIFPGMAIKKMQTSDNQINFKWHKDVRTKKGELIFQVPPDCAHYEINDRHLQAEDWDNKRVVRYAINT